MPKEDWLIALADFIDKKTNRIDYIVYFLKNEINDFFCYEILNLKNACFIYVRPKLFDGKQQLKKIFVVHYDSFKESPAANDNSAAVIQILFFLKDLFRRQKNYSLEVLFTDKEEIEDPKQIFNQGSFIFANQLSKEKKEHYLSFHFDMCGRGDTVVLSTAAEELLIRRQKIKSKLYKNMQKIKELMLSSLTKIYRGRIYSLPTPFSDNLGFLLQGIPSFHFSLLPFSEAYAYQKSYKKLKDELRDLKQMDINLKDLYKKRWEDIQPETWKKRHTKQDNLEIITSSSLKVMHNFWEAILKVDFTNF